MKSIKYKIYRVSKRKCPTYVHHTGQGTGRLVLGKKDAKLEIEKILKRSLKPDTIFDDTKFEWLFKEPI